MALDFRFYCSSEEQRRTIGDIMHAALKGSPGYINNEILLNIDQEQEGGKYPILLFVGESPDNTEDIDVRLDFDCKAQIVGRAVDPNQFVPKVKEEKETEKVPHPNFTANMDYCDRMYPMDSAYVHSLPSLPNGYKYNSTYRMIRYMGYRRLVAQDYIQVDTMINGWEERSLKLKAAVMEEPLLQLSAKGEVDITDDFFTCINVHDEEGKPKLNQIRSLYFFEFTYNKDNHVDPTGVIFYIVTAIIGDFDDIQGEYEKQEQIAKYTLSRIIHNISQKLYHRGD